MKFIIVLFALAAVACAAVDEIVPIVRSTSDIDVDGSFKYSYETGNGISADAAGNADSVQGRFGYTSPEGQKIELTYVADENGYQPQGSHLPVGPEIPAAILRAIEYIRAHPPKEE